MNLFFYVICILFGTVSLILPALGIAVFLAAIPLLIYFFQVPVFTFSVIVVACLSVLAGAGVRLLLVKSRLTRPAIFLLLLALLYLLSAGAHFAPLLWEYPELLKQNLLTGEQLNPFVFVGETVLLAVAAFFFLATFSQAGLPRAKTIIYAGLLAQGALYVCLFFFDAYWYSKPFPETLLQFHQYTAPGVFAIFSEHNTFAYFWLIHSFLLYGLVFSRFLIIQISALVFFAFYSLLLFLSLSLTGILAYLITLPVLIFVFLKKKTAGWAFRTAWKPLSALLLALVVSTGTGAVVLSRIGEESQFISHRISMISPEELAETAYERRLFPWLVAASMIQDYPILGIGPGRFYLMFKEYREQFNYKDAGWFWEHNPHENAHGFHIQVAAEMGLIGLLLWGCFLAWVLKRCNWQEPVSAAAGLAVVGTVVISLVQHPLLVEPMLLTFAAISAVAASGPARSRPASSWRSFWGDRGRVLLITVVLPIVYCFHLYSAWGRMPETFEYGIYQMEEDDKPFRWTSSLALVRRDWSQTGMPLFLKAHNPDIQVNPLVVRFRQNGTEIGRIALSDYDWHPANLSLEPGSVLALECSRTFKAPGDARVLGVAVSGSALVP